MPLGRALRLPSPKEPARVPLVRVQLGLDELAHLGLVVGGEGGDGADGFAGAAAERGAAGEGAVVAGAGAETVELEGGGVVSGGVEGRGW